MQKLSPPETKENFLITNFKDSFLSDTIIFTFSNYVSTAFSFVSSFIIRKVLGPLTMGLYTELMLIFDYSKFHNLGIINALEREVPFYNGKNELEKVEEVKKTTLAFIILSALNIGTILFIISFFGGVHRIGLRFISIMILVEAIVSFYEALLQSYRNFKIWSLLLIGISIIEVFLKVFLVIKFGLYGLLAAMILTGIISIAAYHLWGNFKVNFSPKIYLKEVIRLLKIGVPLILYRIMYLLSISIDRLVIIYFLGRLQLGYYSIATMVSNYLILMPKFSFKTLYPKLMEDFGKNEDLKEIKKYLITPNKVFGCLFSVLIGLVVIIIPFIVIYFLPRFREGIFAAQIVALSAFFASFIYIWNCLLIARYEQKRLAFLYGIGAAITFVVNLFFVTILHMQLNGVAIATLISQFIFTTLLICDGYRHYTKNFLDHLKLLFGSYLPFLWILGTVLGAQFYSPREISFKSDLVSMSRGCIVFLIFCAPLIYHVIKKERLLHYLFNFNKK